MQKKGESQRPAVLPTLGPGPIDVVGFGENSVDLLATLPHQPRPNDKVELMDLATQPGGQVASALVACARLGCSARYIGVFGSDQAAGIVADGLIREGVAIDDSVHVEAPNRSAIILVDPAASTRTVLWRRAPALDWPAEREMPAAVASARVLLVDATDPAGSLAATERARRAGVPVVLDIDRDVPAAAGLLRRVDIVIAAEGFCEAHTGEASLGGALRALHTAYHPAVVVVTLGADGAIAWDGLQETQAPGFRVDMVDPTGAGDAFRGGFLWAWLLAREAGASLAGLLEAGNAVAALNCRAPGAQAGLPSRADVEAFLTESPGFRSNSLRPAHGTRTR